MASRNYDVRICSCGRIHFLENRNIEAAINSDKELLFICGNCGAATYIGADIEIPPAENMADRGKRFYNMYSIQEHGDFDFNVENLNTSNHNGKDIFKIIYSKGTRVPMMTGYPATSFINGSFYDDSCPELYQLERRDITAKEVNTFLDKWRHDKSTVNMSILISSINDPIKLDALSNYYIPSLNWTGTPYYKK